MTKGGEAVTLAADDITWNFDLPCYGDAVASMTGKSGVGYGTCLVPANVHLFGGVNYTLHATAVYKGVAYDEDFTITGYASTVPYGFVAVTGATVTDTISGSYIFKGSPVEIPNFYRMLTPLTSRWMPPYEIINIFEEEGFIWGGKWLIWDNMHFEYRPELIKYYHWTHE